MKLWLDDVRKPPDESWDWCKSVAEAKKFATLGSQFYIEDWEWSLDHDLGGQVAHYGRGPYDWTTPTGLDFVKWVAEAEIRLPPYITIHSTNHAGAMSMASWLWQYAQHTEQDVSIVIKPMLGKIMDRTPFYEKVQ